MPSSSWAEKPFPAPVDRVDRYASYPYGPYRDSPDLFQHLDEDDSSLPPDLSSPSSTSTSIAPIAQDRSNLFRSMTPAALHDASCNRFRPNSTSTTTPSAKIEDEKLFAPFVGGHSVMSAAADAGGGAFGWASSGTFPYYPSTFSPPKSRKASSATLESLSLSDTRRLSAEEKAALAWKDCGCPDPTEIHAHR